MQWGVDERGRAWWIGAALVPARERLCGVWIKRSGCGMIDRPGERKACEERWRMEAGQLVQERVCRRRIGGRWVKVVVWRQRLGRQA